MNSPNFTHLPDYDRLPEAIKCTMTPKEFAWMSDSDRTRIIEDYCYPDAKEFDE